MAKFSFAAVMVLATVALSGFATATVVDPLDDIVADKIVKKIAVNLAYTQASKSQGFGAEPLAPFTVVASCPAGTLPVSLDASLPGLPYQESCTCSYTPNPNPGINVNPYGSLNALNNECTCQFTGTTVPAESGTATATITCATASIVAA